MHSINRGEKHKVHQVQRKQIYSHKMFKISTIGTNTSTQACWPLVNCVINQQLLETSPVATQTLAAIDIVLNILLAAHQCHEYDSDVICTSQVK